MPPRWIESKSCQQRTRFDLYHFEAPILMEIARLTELIPVRPTDEGMANRELAALQVDIAQREENMAMMMEQAMKSPSLMKAVLAMGPETDRLKERAGELRIAVEAAKTHASRGHDAHLFLTGIIGPAVAGDIDARQRLRTLLNKLPYRLVGEWDGTMTVTSESAPERTTLYPADYVEEPGDDDGDALDPARGDDPRLMG